MVEPSLPPSRDWEREEEKLRQRGPASCRCPVISSDVTAAFRPLSQRAAPVPVMLTAPSSQEERHSLGLPLSLLKGGLLHHSQRPWDANRGTGPCGQVTERGERGNVQPIKDSQRSVGRRLRSHGLLLLWPCSLPVSILVGNGSRH